MQNIYQTYTYLFFKIYQWNKRTIPKSEQPLLNSILVISILFFLNLVTISLIVELISGIKILDFDLILDWCISIIVSLIIIFNFLFFRYRDRYKNIIIYFTERKKSNEILKSEDKKLLAYIIITFASFMITIVYLTYLHQN